MSRICLFPKSKPFRQLSENGRRFFQFFYFYKLIRAVRLSDIARPEEKTLPVARSRSGQPGVGIIADPARSRTRSGRFMQNFANDLRPLALRIGKNRRAVHR